MTKFARLTLLTVAGLFLVAPDTGTTQARQTRQPRSVEEGVLAASAEMEGAAAAVDVDRLFTFVLDTDKGSIIQNGLFLATREEALQQVKANVRAISKIEYRWKRQHVTTLSRDVALLTADGESVVTTTEGQVFRTPFAQTVVFVMRESQWMAIHAHQSSPQAR